MKTFYFEGTWNEGALYDTVAADNHINEWARANAYMITSASVNIQKGIGKLHVHITITFVRP